MMYINIKTLMYNVVKMLEYLQLHFTTCIDILVIALGIAGVINFLAILIYPNLCTD